MTQRITTGRITTGRLVLIVGPSGSGKDTLLTAAASRIGTHPRIRLARRAITRPPGEEANEGLSEAEFAARDAAGGFALRWQAHGLSYGIPADITADLQAGHLVIANVSRGVVEDAAARFPVTVIEITAPPALRAERLAGRGREDAAAVAERLSRHMPLPAHLDLQVIVNDGTVEAGATALASCLLRCLEDAGADA